MGVRQLLLDIRDEDVTFFRKQVSIGGDGLSNDREKVVILFQSFAFDGHCQPAFGLAV